MAVPEPTWPEPVAKPVEPAKHRYLVTIVRETEVEATDVDEARMLASLETSYGEDVEDVERLGPAAPDEPDWIEPVCPEAWRPVLDRIRSDRWRHVSLGTFGAWLTQGHIALRLPGGFTAIAPADEAKSSALLSLPGTPAVMSEPRAYVPECSTLRFAHDPCQAVVDLGPVSIDHRYAWVVETIFPGVTWTTGDTNLSATHALLDGEIVALVMPRVR